MKRTKLDLLIERCSEGAPRKSCELCCCTPEECWRALHTEYDEYMKEVEGK